MPLSVNRPVLHHHSYRILNRRKLGQKYIAKAQGNILYQLRNATTLAQLSLDKDQAEEARAVLGPVIESFHEGHHTPHLVAARSVLARCD